jgi:hypothetical protein
MKRSKIPGSYFTLRLYFNLGSEKIFFSSVALGFFSVNEIESISGTATVSFTTEVVSEAVAEKLKKAKMKYKKSFFSF